MKNITLVIAFILALSVNVLATTWGPAEHQCPVCKAKNTYQEIASYGSYIYQWPEKYQYIYWPMTDGYSVYCCPDCHFSAYMWDFDSIPENKRDTIKKFLETVKLDKKYEDYSDIPMATRLEIAEKVYQILGRDDEFWCRFYRVCGFWGDENKALQSRTKALELAEKMLNDTSYSGQEKEKLFIIAAMYNYTGQKDSALVYLDKAKKYTYTNTAWKKENAEGLDEYLTDLIVQYKEFIRKGGKED